MKKPRCFHSVPKNKAAQSTVLAQERAVADAGSVMKRSPLRIGSQLEAETPTSLPRPTPSCPEAVC